MRRVLPLVLVGLAALGVTWLVEPNLVIGLRSPRALAWLLGAGAVCAAVGLVAWRLGASPRVAIAAGVLPGVIAAGIVVVRPIVAPRDLVEAFPSAAPTIDPTPATGTPATGAPPASATAAAPDRLASGPLRGLAGHSAKGTVSTYRLPDGSYLVRFEGVDIGGTPDPEVYVLPGRDRTGKRGGTHLGSLKAEKGSFNYALPASFATSDFTVVVWCERFAVDIAHATQGTAAA